MPMLKVPSTKGDNCSCGKILRGLSDHAMGGIKAVMEKYLWNGTCSVPPSLAFC